MEGIQFLYYALGELCYCCAKADGKINREEKISLHNMVINELKSNNLNFDFSEIIFQVLENSDESVNFSYNSAIDMIKKHNLLFSNELKNKFISILKNIALAYPPFSIEEENFIEKVTKDLEELVR